MLQKLQNLITQQDHRLRGTLAVCLPQRQNKNMVFLLEEFASKGEGGYMTDLNKYISDKCASEFSRRVSKLQKKTGAMQHLEHDDPTYGIAGNTFRAFTGWKRKPSNTYKEWAASITEGINAQILGKVTKSRCSFLEWHSDLFRLFQKHWKKKQGKNLSIAHCYKCVDLYVAWLVKGYFGDLSVSQALERVANCPLDKQTLAKLNECYSRALPMGKPTMSHITDINTYNFCQELIGVFVEYADKKRGNRILFDRFAYKRGNG